MPFGDFINSIPPVGFLAIHVALFFLPLTFVVGVYGMNFDFMPELRSRWGYPLVLAAMGGITLTIYLWFRRRGWLRG